MLHLDDEKVRAHLFEGNFGLERENLRVTPEGFLAHTPNPFSGEGHIVRDFSEIQCEINTGVSSTPEACVAELARYDEVEQRTLACMERPELLWPFSNPPYIRSDDDIPIAQFYDEEASKTAYRQYLSDRYGRYKMVFSGIHFNFSFADALLKADFVAGKCEEAACGEGFESTGDDAAAFAAYKDAFYLDLAEKAVAFGWIMTAVTAASPLLDSSYAEKANFGDDLYLGMGSVRCCELGYWNEFTPILDYSDIDSYAVSISHYVGQGLIRQPSELYYPVRVKPRGAYSLDTLQSGNTSHIELRMFDLNPLYPAGVNVSDVYFAQLFLVWLASLPAVRLSDAQQIQAAANFKRAAHYDLRTVKIDVPGWGIDSVSHSATRLLAEMEAFLCDVGAPQKALDCLAFQRRKFTDPDGARYTHIVRGRFSGGFVQKGLQLAREYQKRALQTNQSAGE